MRDTRDRDGATAGKSSETMVSCVCATVPSALMASLYGKFTPLDLTANGSERDMVRSGHELEMTNEALRQRVAELEAKNEELEAFAHTVAHDLKGPICNLAGCADFMGRAYTSMSDGELQKCFGMIHRSALKLGDIVDELLLLCGLSYEKAETTDLDMTSIVGRALHRLTYRIEDNGARVALPETWPVAVGYGPWIEEVWVNYIDNAIKYGGRPAYVELGAERVNGTSRFWVRDNGRGLTTEERNNLFAPFTRLNQVQTQGHGLGLSIVRHIVEKLDGEVSVESSSVPGQGSTFSFTLPAERRSNPEG
jgi:two-component system sensor histidine kinase/response regulator